MTQPDYNQLWKTRWYAAKGELPNPYDLPEKAAQYDASAPIWADGLVRAAAFPASAADTVLDIGSGPGILALPLARRVRSVTAIEPSAAMRTLLERHRSEQEINNLRVLPLRWEEVQDIELHDVVIASYSLSFPDLKTALEKMQAAARRRVYLYWFAGRASWEQLQADLLKQVTGRQYHEQPKSDLIYGLLLQMGVSPDVRALTDTRFCYDYPSVETAVDQLRDRLGAGDRSCDSLLADYIRRHYQPLENGGWRFWDQTHYVELSWNPSTRLEAKG